MSAWRKIRERERTRDNGISHDRYFDESSAQLSGTRRNMNTCGSGREPRSGQDECVQVELFQNEIDAARASEGMVSSQSSKVRSIESFRRLGFNQTAEISRDGLKR
jgi:hypothetical protein